ncbi:diguanylate cyclase [Litchfieldella qijiaojingensis]|uniref:diguanylate cyclase n=1 Tax=Litchfieldella qijiaojingensis TaxID=980347 RepID=A0ABQ2YR60_9GAMM|nr:GGDEF domain-containing protein [Halomonas qijiaojingensis]GGX92660.1 diguanylate cyclase [Halomonas qijiaojingensis]
MHASQRLSFLRTTWRVGYLVLAWMSLELMGPDVQAGENDLTPVSLQLHWYHQFQFAGYYAAEAQGYFRDAGLEVEIRDSGYEAAGKAVDPVEEVVFQRADFGVSRADLLIHHSQGLPVVVLANIMQRSPLVFLTLERYGFSRLEDIGQRPISVTLPGYGTDKRLSAETVAAFRRARVDIRELNNSPPTWQLDDLFSGKTQLTAAYSTAEAYFVRQRGGIPVEIHPRDYGIDLYGDLLFTNAHFLEQEPEIVAAFRQAALKGWRYAMAHPEEVAELILERYPPRTPDYDRDFLIHEASRIRELMQPDLIEIGYSNPARWQSIASIYRDMGLIENVDLDTFLHDPQDPSPNIADLWQWSVPGAVMILLALGTAGYLHTVNRRLTQEVSRRRSAEAALRQQAEQDGLTGIDNRRLFEEHFHREFSRARRHGHPLSLIVFDVDLFKAINDNFGHLAGDRVLIAIARITRGVLRTSDHFARYGGEEFAVILPDTGIDEARLVAERIWQVNRDHAVQDEARSIRYTLSLGVAELSPSDVTAQAFFMRVDTLLYQAKNEGRDRLCLEAV